MKNEKTKFYLGFSYFVGIGPIRFAALLKKFDLVNRAHEASEKEIATIIGSPLAKKFIEFRNKFDAEKKLAEIRKKNILVLTQEDARFPSQLKTIPDPPICLYIKGDIDNYDFKKELFLAAVGTRKPTPYGQQIAKKFVFELSSCGFVIVSGLAMGIDTIAHEAALEAGGKTIAVLGCGVDMIYPQINSNLYHRIIQSGGLIVSEFPPGHFVLKGLFIARNRLISGLAKGVLVVEGAADSGALITARYAAEQGKDVFALPGPLTSQMSEAPNLLIKQGANLITSVADILDEFNLKISPVKINSLKLRLSGKEKIILTALLKEANSADGLVEISRLSINEVLNALSNLEIKGVIEKNSEGKYQIR